MYDDSFWSLQTLSIGLFEFDEVLDRDLIIALSNADVALDLCPLDLLSSQLHHVEGELRDCFDLLVGLQKRSHLGFFHA